MRTVTVKFGGSSLADAAQIKKAVAIIKADPARRFVVVSAPGKRCDTDIKVTDLLISCWKLAHEGEDFSPVLEKVRDRFADIIAGLGIEFDLAKEIEIIRVNLSSMPHQSYILSRGEYLNGRIIAAYMRLPFVDPAFHIHFQANGQLDEQATHDDLAQTLLPLEGAVIPGFYGSRPDGAVQTFSRGGSDVTGSLVAEAVEAELYENWTDVSGLLAADPRIVDAPRTVDYINYKELRVLSYMGASVLHTDAVRPVRKSGIPINIRNTNRPEDAGTMIVPKLPKTSRAHAVTGVAGRKGLSVVQVEKTMVSDGAGFTAILLDIFRKYSVPFEQCLTGIDTISIVIRTDLLEPKKNEILGEITSVLEPDTLSVLENLAMITVTGEKKSENGDMTAIILHALAQSGIRVSTINQGAAGLNLIIGVEDSDYREAIKTIYHVIE